MTNTANAEKVGAGRGRVNGSDGTNRNRVLHGHEVGHPVALRLDDAVRALRDRVPGTGEVPQGLGDDEAGVVGLLTKELLALRRQLEAMRDGGVYAITGVSVLPMTSETIACPFSAMRIRSRSRRMRSTSRS